MDNEAREQRATDPADAPPAPPSESGRPWRVGISGSYGGLNLGDEAILEGILGSLRAEGPIDITLFSRDPADSIARHGVARALDRPRTSRAEARAAIDGLDLFILGGGGLLFDAEADLYLREVVLAQQLGVPTMTYSVSAGPLEEASTRELVQETLSRCTAVTVRDGYSQRLLEEVGVEREVVLTADPAMLIEREPLDDVALRADGFEEHPRLIAFSVREPGPAAPGIDPDHYHALLADAGDYVVDRLDAHVVFIPLERKSHDLQHSHAVVSKMKRAERATVLKREYSAGQLLSLMNRFQFAVGMRLHFLIFATLAGVPFVALPYASKVQGYLDDLDLDMPVLGDRGAGQLIAHIDRSWDDRESVRRRIGEKLPELRERARRSGRIASSILRGDADAGTAAS